MSRIKTTLYSTTACPYCKMLKDYLNENKISYEEKMVDTDEEAREEMIEQSGGFMGVPFTVVEKEGGHKENVIGFDKEKLNNLFEL